MSTRAGKWCLGERFNFFGADGYWVTAVATGFVPYIGFSQTI